MQQGWKKIALILGCSLGIFYESSLLWAAVVQSVPGLACTTAAAEKGNPHAQLALGLLYLQGLDHKISKNIQEAAYWLQKAANNQASIGRAKAELGHLYRDGLGVPRDLQQAKFWYQAAAAQGEVAAMLILGELAEGWYGNESQAKRSEAITWYQKAASAGSSLAEFRMGWLLVREFDPWSERPQALSTLMSAAQNKQPHALSQMGDLYYQGKLGAKNLEKAHHYYQQAAEMKLPSAAFKLAMLYANGEGVPQNGALAHQWMEQSAACGLAAAALQLGEWYFQGVGCSKDLKKAAHWYEKAAEAGLTKAQVRLADLYHAGKGGLPRSLESAITWYEKAAEQNDTYAQYMLSEMYSQERGNLRLDLVTSVKWFKLANRNPDRAWAKYKIGENYQQGHGFSQNQAQAFRWYHQAAEDRLMIAQTKLGDLYALHQAAGSEASEQEKQSFNWFSKAANAGDAYAQYRLALICLDHLEENPRNATKAFHWFQKSAYQGFRPAQLEMGMLYHLGLIVPQNPMKAYAWLRLGSRETADATLETVLDLVGSMQPEAREKAAVLAQTIESRVVRKQEQLSKQKRKNLF